MRFPASQRLKRQADFDRQRQGSRRFDAGAFMLTVKRRDPAPGLADRRFGVIASRKVGNAVHRNRAKRRFRELFRLNQGLLPPVCDVVVVVRPSVHEKTHQQLADRFTRFCKQASASAPATPTPAAPPGQPS